MQNYTNHSHDARESQLYQMPNDSKIQKHVQLILVYQLRVLDWSCTHCIVEWDCTAKQIHWHC